MRELLRRSPLLRAIRFLPFALLYRLATVLTRPSSSRFLFLSDSHEGFTGNFAHLRRALIRQQPGVDIRGVFKPSLRARRSVIDALRLPFLMARSAVIVLDDFYPLIYPIRLRSGTRLVQLWHAAGAFKQVGHSRAGLPGGPTPNSGIHRNYTDAFVSSEAIRADYAEAFGIDRDRVQALGVPRTDFFFDETRVGEARARTRAQYGVRAGERLVLYAPTFRGAGQLSAYADESVDWTDVARALGDGWRIAVRLHPFTPSARPPSADVIDASRHADVDELLAAADVLVTDYSSVIFEYALLRRPIVLFTPDIADYRASRAFYRPFERYAIGPVVEKASELAAAIRSASVDEERLPGFIEEFCGSLDGRSSERIASVLLAHAGHEQPQRRTIVHRLRLHLLAANAARTSLAVISVAMRAVPRRRKITMITREHRSPPLDLVLLEQAIARQDPTVETVIIARMVPPGIIRKFGYAVTLICELYHVASSRVLVVDGYSIVASAAHHGAGLTIVQIWHALGALKKFGLSILDQPEGRQSEIATALRMHSNYDVVVASAERCREPFAEALGVHPSQVLVSPLPRVDYLRDQHVRARARARLSSIHPELDGRPIAVFAPTFRAHGTEPGIDPIALTEALAARGYATITKLHPILPQPTHPSLTTAPGMSTQDLLHVADVFVTDYSSAVFEAAVAGVPSYLLAPDLDQYTLSRSFYLDYPDDLGLPFARSIEELVQVIDADACSRARVELLADRFIELDGDGPSAAADALAARILDAASVDHRRTVTAEKAMVP